MNSQKKPSALVAISDGSEELEAITVIDILRRAGVEVTVASVSRHLQVMTSRQCQLVADVLLSDISSGQAFDMIVLPGGMPGSKHFAENEELIKRLNHQWMIGGKIAAICAAPAWVLPETNFIQGRKVTCYPGLEDNLISSGAIHVNEWIVKDGPLITSQGPATSMMFALTLAKELCGSTVADTVGEALLYQ